MRYEGKNLNDLTQRDVERMMRWSFLIQNLMDWSLGAEVQAFMGNKFQSIDILYYWQQ